VRSSPSGILPPGRPHRCGVRRHKPNAFYTDKRQVHQSQSRPPPPSTSNGNREIRSTVVRIKGHGLQIRLKPKSRTGYRKSSEDAVRVLEIIGRPHQAQVTATWITGLRVSRAPNLGFLEVDLGDRSSRVDLPEVLAPRVGLEPTTLRLTDAGRSLVSPRNLGMRRSSSGVGVWHGAGRCGQNCGHGAAVRRPA
jgi:hypothetical protein